jgi:hypothetical protein
MNATPARTTFTKGPQMAVTKAAFGVGGSLSSTAIPPMHDRYTFSQFTPNLRAAIMCPYS